MGKATGKPSSSSSKQPDNEKVNSATASCPLQKNTKKPCDVASLKVADGASGRSLEISKSRITDPALKDAQLLMWLLNYDAVLELLSSYTNYGGNDENAKKKNVKLNISAVPVGSCPLNKHLAIKVVPLDSRDKEDGKEWVNTTPDTLNILGRSRAKDHGLGQWLGPFWQFGEAHVKQLLVTAESCGVLASGKPNRTLKCLVRIYRDDIYTLKFSVPSFKSFSHDIEAKVDRHGTVSRESSSEASRFGDKVRVEKHSSETNAAKGTDFKSSEYGGVDKDGVYHSQKFGQGTKDNNFSMERTATRTTQDGIPGLIRGGTTETYKVDTKGKETFVGKLEPQKIKPSISLKRNDTELDFTKAANQLLDLQGTITKTLNDIQKWVPDIGLKLKVELSIMTGEITGSWGNRYPETPKDGERYKLVEEFFDIDFNLEVIKYSVVLSAGIDFSSPKLFEWIGLKFEVILKVAGKLFGEVVAKAKLTSLAVFEPLRVTGDSTLDIFAHGKITALGITYEAKGGVTGGIKFEGTLVGGLRVTPHIDGEFIFVQTKAYVKLVKEVSERSKRFETVIFEKKEIWKGKLPNTA